MAKKNSKVTPARRQYLDFKAQYPNAVVFFRMGDFFECFDDDAELVSRELEITLTSRPLTKDGERIPMAGVPHHAVDGYIARLVEKGYHVAVIDQIGNDPIDGIVPRKVTQVVTPGTVTEPAMLREHQNNYLMGLALEADRGGQGFSAAGIAYVDITTGEFQTTEVTGDGAPVKVLEEITRLNPREVLMGQTWATNGATLPPGSHLTPRPDFQFEPGYAAEALRRHFQVKTLDGFGLSGMTLAVCAAGAVLEYLKETQRGSIEQIISLRYYNTSRFMTLDTATRRNLELTETIRGGTEIGSLLRVLDRTVTPMGARLLRKWIGQPLLDLDRLNARLDAVDALYQSGTLRAELHDLLRQISDLERLTNRVLTGRVGPRELLVLADGLNRIPEVRRKIQGVSEMESLYERLNPCDEVCMMIEETLTDDPPAVMNVIGTIRQGVSEELDHLYRTSREARDYIANLESVEKERTGLKTLKVGYNKVFGYYIEISRGLSERAPEHYIRKQTLVNAERFITPEMKDYENIIMNADDRLLEIEKRLYEDLLRQIRRHSQAILSTANAVAHIDTLLSFAEVAARENYIRPLLTGEDVLEIKNGRHPVVEKTLKTGRFVPNDCFFDTEQRIHIITGPNMAGKSTYLRQVALIVLMAQIGSFVPADEARIGLVDRIFTRVGAQDEIHAGQSTFMVEMTETANILANATPQSLVVLDEIGRGTSTYDGMSIARAVLEYIHNSPNMKCKTLFATHYHELTELEVILPGVINYNVQVAEEGDTVVFLHQVAPGKADRSYGIHVAQLAGVPRAVVNRAKEILADLEAQGSDFKLKKTKKDSAHQISMFDDSRHPVLEALKALKIDQMSPIDAMTRLYELQRMAKQE
jgi:DNA mismatch repair protein MutS